MHRYCILVLRCSISHYNRISELSKWVSMVFVIKSNVYPGGGGAGGGGLSCFLHT